MTAYHINETRLVFTADRHERADILRYLRKGEYWRAYEVAFEYPLCNGLSEIPPEDIGALTSSLMFSEDSKDDDGNYPDAMVVYWFPNYQVEDPLATLAHTGSVTFPKEP